MNFVRISPGPVSGLVALLVSALAQFAIERRMRLLTSLATGLGVGLLMRVIDEVTKGRPGRFFLSRPRAAGRMLGAPDETLASSAQKQVTTQELVGVVPIAQSRSIDRAQLTLLSLEAYRDGFLINGRLLAEPREPSIGGTIGFPMLVMRATDDRGARYQHMPRDSGGDGREYRFTHQFTPALDPTAEELRIDVPEIEWRRVTGVGIQQQETQPGPWTFTVALSGREP